jgi:iron complex transport system ATP-binding protein
MNHQTSLSLEQVRFRYPEATDDVVRNVSLEIPSQKVTAILGPNGAGKTTLLHVILGLLKPAAGRICLNGRAHHEYTHRERSQLIGLVPQFETIPFNFTVLEYILLGRTPYLDPFQTPGEDDLAVAQQVVEQLGLSELHHKSVTQISGGERQMVLLARALAQQTQILLLDEPTSHLDLGNKSRLLRLLRSLAESGITIVFTTHDPNVATYIADAVLLMDGGDVVEHGPIEQVFTPEKLSAIYRVPVHVERQNGQIVVLMEK